MTDYRSPGWLVGKGQARLYEAYYQSPVSKWRKPRRTRAYCVGTAKSGTHSVASLFRDRLRTFHEADWRQLIRLVLGVADGRVARAALTRRLLRRDRRFALDVDSSQLNYFYLAELLKLFPDAKFILTLRDPYTWLDSLINHQLARGRPPAAWQRLRDFRFGQGAPHPDEERALRERQLYTLDGYLSYWARHNRGVLEQVPTDKLLVVRTDQITARADELAHFLGLPAKSRPGGREQPHSYRALQTFGVLAELDRGYLEHKVRQHGGELVRTYFPEYQL